MDKTPEQKAVDTLNEAYILDPVLISKLQWLTLPCVEGLMNHPTIHPVKTITDTYRVSLLDLINGVIEGTTGHRVMPTFEDNTGVLSGFVLVKSE